MPRTTTFAPNVELYGRDVYTPFGSRIGKLDRIVDPHNFIIGGVEWSCDSTCDLFEDRGKLYLDGFKVDEAQSKAD